MRTYWRVQARDVLPRKTPWQTIARETSDYDARLVMDAARRGNGLREYRIMHGAHRVARPDIISAARSPSDG